MFNQIFNISWIAISLAIGIYFEFGLGGWLLLGLMMLSLDFDDKNRTSNTKHENNNPNKKILEKEIVEKGVKAIENIKKENQWSDNDASENIRKSMAVFSAFNLESNNKNSLDAEEVFKLADDMLNDQDKNLPILIFEKYGISIKDKLIPRFMKSGWFYSGPTLACCPQCNSSLEVFRKKYETKKGVTYFYYGLFCISCEEIYEAKDLNKDDKKILKKEHVIPLK